MQEKPSEHFNANGSDASGPHALFLLTHRGKQASRKVGPYRCPCAVASALLSLPSLVSLPQWSCLWANTPLETSFKKKILKEMINQLKKKKKSHFQIFRILYYISHSAQAQWACPFPEQPQGTATLLKCPFPRGHLSPPQPPSPLVPMGLRGVSEAHHQ